MENPGQPAIQIDLYNGCFFLKPISALEDLAPLLSFEPDETEVQKSGKLKRVTETDVLYTIDEIRQVICVPAGLLKPVRRHLRELSIDVEFTKLRNPAFKKQRSSEFYDEASEEHGHLLDAVKKRPLGQIEIANEKEMVDYIELIYH